MLEETIKILESDLSKDLVSWRDEPWAKTAIPYIKSFEVINQANKIFGFDGWSYRIVEMTETSKVETENNSGKRGHVIGVSAHISVTVLFADGRQVIREDIGYGTGIDYSSMSEAKAYESAGKEAVSDGLKRALRTFGNQFANQLYDQAYVSSIRDDKKSPATTQAPARKISKQVPAGRGDDLATDSQKRYINDLSRKNPDKLTELLNGKSIDKITKIEAGNILVELQK